MREKSYIFCFITFSIIFTMTFFLGNRLGKNNEKIVSDKADAKVVKEEVTSKISNTFVAGTGYFIKTNNGYIVIYNHAGEVVSNTEISVANFTDQEKHILESGIYVESAEDLFRYLESYTS